MKPGTRLALAVGGGLFLVGLPVLLVVLLVGVTVLSAAAASSGQACSPTSQEVTGEGAAGGRAGGLLPGLSTNPRVRAQQWANAAAIIAQGLADGVPPQGLVIAVMTARQESTLINVGYGDHAGPDAG